MIAYLIGFIIMTGIGLGIPAVEDREPTYIVASFIAGAIWPIALIAIIVIGHSEQT